MYITSSQKFVQETELSQRIRDWEDMVQPRLQEQVRVTRLGGHAGICLSMQDLCPVPPRSSM